MNTRPDVQLLDVLRRVARRLRWQAAARSASLGACVALVPFLLTHQLGLTVASAAAGAVVAWWPTRRTQEQIAAHIESRAPQCRNVLITAEALLATRLSTTSEVRAVVLHDAARHAAAIEPAVLWPWRRAALALAGTAGLWILAIFGPGPALNELVQRTAEASATPTIERVDLVLTPPAYTGRSSETVRDPERIAPLAGSRVHVNVTSTAAAVSLETPAGIQRVTRAGDGGLSGEVVVETDGYLALTPFDTEGRAGVRRLIGVTAVADRLPEVRVSEPAKDLFVRSGDLRLTVRLQASDDIGLRSLRLVYTKAAGAGEAFTFTEGETPVTVTRASDREWTAVGVLPLDQMTLDVGDLVVYRAVATDGRPGATPVESDAFVVEIVSASNAMAEGFSIDERQDKYALSQQMVILKTERLIARAPTSSRDVMLEEAMGIAAEQRSVRAELMFMMGGEFQDEVVEAEHEDELSAGRLDNSGRADLGLATRAMSRAATQLTDVDLETALATEREALVAMQRALSRRRFILRTLTQRLPIDDSRRLSGQVADLGRGLRVVDEAAVSDRVAAVRSAYLAIIDVSGPSTLTLAHAATLSEAAAALLAADGRSTPMVDVASRLNAAVEAIVAGAPDEARRALTDAATQLAAIVSAELAPAPAAAPETDAARLRGALADALRTGGGG